jgi:two-component system sensor histidine kinase UhpB
MIISEGKLFDPLAESRPLRFLILEDSTFDVELLKVALKTDEFDFEYKVVWDRKEFESALKKYNPDVILSDFTLPQFNGLEALKMVKDKNLNRPFIIVTGAVDEETAVACIKSGADDYLLKDRLTRLPSAIIHSIEQCKITIEKENTRIELEKSRYRLRELFKRIEHIRDDEKKRISLEIHDQLGQELTASKLGLFWLKQNIIINSKDNISACKPLLSKIEELIDLSGKTIKTIRRITHQLRPVVLDDLGLIPAIEWMVKNFEDSTDISCSFNHELSEDLIGEDFSSVAYRIVQECLTNIMRHSEAKYCGIDFKVNKVNFHLDVWDNGKGFNIEKHKETNKLGLFGILERIKPYDGQMEIESEPGGGTRIIIKVPSNNIVK